ADRDRALRHQAAAEVDVGVVDVGRGLQVALVQRFPRPGCARVRQPDRTDQWRSQSERDLVGSTVSLVAESLSARTSKTATEKNAIASRIVAAINTQSLR